MKNGAIFMIDDWQAIFIILHNITSYPQKKRKSRNFLSSLANYIYTPPQPLKGVCGVALSESRFPLQAKPPLSKGGLEGLSIWSRTLPRNAQKKG